MSEYGTYTAPGSSEGTRRVEKMDVAERENEERVREMPVSRSATIFSPIDGLGMNREVGITT